MSRYVPRGEGGSVVIGTVYSDMGADKGNAAVSVEVAPSGEIVVKSGYYSDKASMFSVTRAEQVVELLQKGIAVAGQIDRLFADLKLQEKEGLERICAVIKEGTE